MPMKNPKGVIEKRTRNLPTPSAVPQLYGPPRISQIRLSENIIDGHETKGKLINMCLFSEDNFGT